MTDVTVTVAAKDAFGPSSFLKAYFDDVEGPFPAIQLTLNVPNSIQGLPDGLYQVILSGVHLKTGVPIAVTFAAGDNDQTRDTEASQNGALATMIDFYLSNGDAE
jgi:hypothetical protein